MRRRGAIKAKQTPDGGLEIQINCRETEQEAIAELTKDAAQAWQDDTFGMHDRIRDQEHRERCQTVEEETINLRVEITKSVRRSTRNPLK
jgi:hypothetical protein